MFAENLFNLFTNTSHLATSVQMFYQRPGIIIYAVPGDPNYTVTVLSIYCTIILVMQPPMISSFISASSASHDSLTLLLKVHSMAEFLSTLAPRLSLPCYQILRTQLTSKILHETAWNEKYRTTHIYKNRTFLTYTFQLTITSS